MSMHRSPWLISKHIVVVLQRAADANLLSSQQADAIASGAQHVTDLLDAARINTLFSNPVEVVAFCDEEGIR